VERTGLILHLLDLLPSEGGDPLEHFDLINRELARHSDELAGKSQIVVLTKLDVTEVREMVPRYVALFRERGFETFAVSAVTGEGIDALVGAVGTRIDERRAAEKGAALDSDEARG
jgi:GTP-binding protein